LLEHVSPGIKWPELEADILPLSTDEIKNAGSFSYIPFVSLWCLSIAANVYFYFIPASYVIEICCVVLEIHGET
jgi:hypothetical protein